MLGAISGDVIGSVFEFAPIKEKGFPLFSQGSIFTDDSVMVLAVARAILTDGDYGAHMFDLGRQYPHAGYGGMFSSWLALGGGDPYNSFGNGSAMRVAPVGWAFETLEQTLEEAGRSAAVTHNHPEGIKGARSVAGAVFLARHGIGKREITDWVSETFDYDLDRLVEDIRPRYSFDVTCQGSVPEAIVAFLDADGFEDAVRNAVSLGGDADTQACITGAIAEAFWGEVPADIARKVTSILDPSLLDIYLEFRDRFDLPKY